MTKRSEQKPTESTDSTHIENDTKSVDNALKHLSHATPLCVETCLFTIDNQGQWFYQNEPLPTKFARLFSSILHCIDEEHFLITPVEKLRVSVTSTPLLIVDYQQVTSEQFTVTTSLETQFELTGFSSFLLDEDGVYTDLPRGLRAKLGRACYYRFVEEYLVGDESNYES